MDGSLLVLPYSEELSTSFGVMKNQKELKVVGAKCSMAYDVCNELILDASIGPRKSCEKELAVNHLNQLCPQTDILVFDRGYPALWLMGLLEKRGFKYCFRLSTAWKDAVSSVSGNETDIDWSGKRRSDKDLGKLREYNLPLEICGLRLVSIELSTGEKEVLATNLTDRSNFDIDTLKELYHLRWGVEESYKMLKQVAQVEYFTGKTVLAIKQDFYSRIFTLNMASMVATQGLYKHKQEKEKKNKYKVKPNKTQVLAKTKDFLVEIFYTVNPRKLLEQMIKLLEKCFEIIRPNRSFPRPNTATRRHHKHTNSKGI
ncbi:MAG: transposase [Sporocytophaga sp.]|nr:transposase [Sporocytophaga sp.]